MKSGGRRIMDLSVYGGSLYCLSMKSYAIKGMWKQRKIMFICLLLSSFDEAFPPCVEEKRGRVIYSDRNLSKRETCPHFSL